MRRASCRKPSATPGRSGLIKFGGVSLVCRSCTRPTAKRSWFHDVRHPQNRSRKVATFHTPNALRELLERESRGRVRQAAYDSAESRTAAVSGGGQHGDRAGHRRRQAQDAGDDGDRHRQDADDGQRDLPADEVRRRPSRAVPGRPPGTGRADGAGVRAASRQSLDSSSTRSTRSTRSAFSRATSTRTRSSTRT